MVPSIKQRKNTTNHFEDIAYIKAPCALTIRVPMLKNLDKSSKKNRLDKVKIKPLWKKN